MQPAVLIRLRPTGPWRSGDSEGGRDRVDALFRSDRLFSALCIAAKQLGFAEEWLDATARSSSPALSFSSLFPFQGETLYVAPPATLWPPPASRVTAPSPLFLNKVRWNAARFVPLSLVDSILAGQKVLADQWIPDPESGCLLRRDRPSTTPFRTVLRNAAAVDRVTGSSSAAHSFACVEFEPGAGLWTAVRFAHEESQRGWSERLKGAFRLLADTGLGGRRGIGWGSSQTPEFQEGTWPNVLLPRTSRAASRAEAAEPSSSFWLLSLFAPGQNDSVDWSDGDYRFVERGGPNRKRVRLIAEGSVVSSGADSLNGAAVDITGGHGGKRVYRSGLALSLRLPLLLETPAETVMESQSVEIPSDVDAPDPSPCETVPEPENIEPAATGEEATADEV